MLLVNTVDKLTTMRASFGRVEANHIATNPMIFDELKIGDNAGLHWKRWLL